MQKGRHLGLVGKEMTDRLNEKIKLTEEGKVFFNSNTISPKNINEYLLMKRSSELTQSEFLSNIIKRNEVKLGELLELEIFKENVLAQKIRESSEAVNQIEIEIKYKGYIERQNEQIDNFEKNEGIRIPDDFKFEKIKSLSSEAIEKLGKVKPNSIGQAMRISGVRPSDISAIMVYMRG